MKRSLFLIVLGLVAWAAFAEDELDFYKSQFNNALTAADQLSVLRIARDAELDSSFYSFALKRLLVAYPNFQGNKEMDAADESIRLITDQLTEDQSDAGQDLWRVVQIFSNPLVKSDAVIAIGKVNAKDKNLFPHVVQILKDTNASPNANRISGERMAYGAIEALEKYEDINGYLPVFFAANGWYSPWVKQRAKEVLAKLSEDPSQPLTEVIKGASYTYGDKYLALKEIEISKIDDSAKGKIAVEALYESWRVKGFTSDARTQRELIEMRKYAIGMISKYAEGIDDERVYKLLERSYRYAVDEDEQIKVISALQNMKSDDAAKLLITFTALINDKFERGIIQPADERAMRALIFSLGENGNAAGKPVLQHILALGWSYNVHKLAQEALNKIGG